MITDKEEKKHKTESALIVQNRWATIGTQKRKSSGTPSTLSLVIPHFRSDLFIIMIFYDIINEYNSTSRSPNPGQVRSNAKFYSPSFYRKYENNDQVLASFGQTASTTKLVQVNWEKLKHLKSCLFV